MAALDEHAEPPQRDLTSPFSLPIDNFITVPSRGTVVVGTLERGVMKKGQEVELIGRDLRLRTTITGMQVFHKDVVRCEAGQNVAVVLRNIKRKDISRGMTLTPKGSA